MTADDKFRPCTAGEITKMQATNAKESANEVSAGERRWVRKGEDLPGISDGGCMQVTVYYDVAAKHFLLMACNGLG